MRQSQPSEPRYFVSARPTFFTLENRILLLGLVTTTALVATACGFSVQFYTDAVENRYENTMDTLTATVADLSAQQLQAGKSAPDIEKSLERLLLAQPDFAYLALYDNEGQLLARREIANRMLGEKLVQRSMKVRGTLDGIESSLGTIRVGITGKSLSQEVRSMQLILVFAFAGAWFIACIAVVGITWILSRHMRELVRGVKRLSTGDFGYRIPSDELWGELKHLAESFNDMSTRLRVYEDQNIDTLTFERNKLEAILLSITDGVVVADTEGEIVIINESAADMLDVHRDVVMGSKISEYTGDDGEKCFAKVIQEFLKHQEEGPPEPMVQSLEIAHRTLRVIISPIRDTEGASLGYVMILRDITREMEIDKMKTQFISNVSHELRTPVTTIKSYVDTLFNHGDELDEETYREFMQTINIETDRLKKMVNDILDFSRLEAPEYKMEMDYQDVSPIINITVQSIKMLAEQKQLTISTAIETGLPRVYINSDSIERVLRNLLSNAIKYTPEGGRIKVRAEVAAGGDALEVSVQDTGDGIPEEHLPRIWDRFYRVENKVHTVKGTGLGLHLVKVAIEEHHHGQVFVMSETGKGCTFGFRLPLIAGGPLANDVVPSDDEAWPTSPARRITAS